MLTKELKMFLIESAIITLVVYLINTMYFKQSKRPYIYIVLFFLLASLNFVFNKLEASENKKIGFEYPIDYIPDAKIEINYLSVLRAYKLSPEDRKFYEGKVRFHKSNAERTFRDAKNKCWYLPDIDYRQKAQTCLAAAITAISAGSGQAAVVSGLAVIFIDYGFEVLDEWEYIRNKLHWSQYHYEMMEFYQDLLKNG